MEKCANGCGIPPAPPSKVICKKCQHAITRKLEKMLDKYCYSCGNKLTTEEYRSFVPEYPFKKCDSCAE